MDHPQAVVDGWHEWGVIIAAAGLAILLLTTVGGLIWKLSRIEISVRAEADEKINNVRADAEDKINAQREKLYQVEIWARDQFVRKGSFELVVARIELGMRDLGTRVEGAVDKMTARFDEHRNRDQRD
jgi:hypothetical protein